MKVIVFGATGGTGRALLGALSSGGHQASAFARDPAKLRGIGGITAVTGDVMRPADVAAAIPGHDAVIVSLGNSQNPFGLLLGVRRTTAADVCEVGTGNVIAAMRDASVTRLVVVTAFGVGDTRGRLPLAFKLFYRLVLREQMADKERQEALVKASDLDWTLVQPVGLTGGPATGIWLADTDGTIRRQQISRADVAAFLVGVIGGDTYPRKTVSLSG